MKPTFLTRGRLAFYTGLVLLTGWVFLLALFGPGGRVGGPLPTPSLSAPESPQQTDYRWTLRDLDDAPVDFAQYRGKAVFLNVWATWCPPCLAELPSIANLADHARLKGMTFLCVSTDDSAESVRRYLKDKHWAMTVLRATDIPETFATDGIPATFVIAPDGRVVASEIGAVQWDAPAAVDFLESVIKQGAPAQSPQARP